MSVSPIRSQDVRRSRADRDVSQSESVASTTSAADEEDNEGYNEEENPEDSEGQLGNAGRGRTETGRVSKVVQETEPLSPSGPSPELCRSTLCVEDLVKPVLNHLCNGVALVSVSL